MKQIDTHTLTGWLSQEFGNRARSAAVAVYHSIYDYRDSHQDICAPGHEVTTAEGVAFEADRYFSRDSLCVEIGSFLNDENWSERAERALEIVESELAALCRAEGEVEMAGIGTVTYKGEVVHTLTSAEASILAKHEEYPDYADAAPGSDEAVLLDELRQIFRRPGLTRPVFGFKFTPDL